MTAPYSVGALVWVSMDVVAKGALVSRRFKAQVIKTEGTHPDRRYQVRLESDGTVHWAPWFYVSRFRALGAAR